MEGAGDDGCDVASLKDLAKKHGGKDVANALRAMVTSGKLTYTDTKLRLPKVEA